MYLFFWGEGVCALCVRDMPAAANPTEPPTTPPNIHTHMHQQLNRDLYSKLPRGAQLRRLFHNDATSDATATATQVGVR